MLVDQLSPFFDVGKTLEEMDRVFNRMGQPLGLRSVPRSTFPAINVYGQDEGIVLAAKIPGVRPDDLELTVLNDSVTLKGQRQEAEPSNGSRMYRRERAVGAFARTVTLPESVDPNSVQARYQDGILRVRMSKAQEAKPKKVKLKS
jgi:HSP20 family protein